MSIKPTSGKNPEKRETQEDAVLIQLSSQRPSDIWRGMDQARQWLKENPENRDVFGLLLDAVKKNRGLRGQVRDLFLEMMENGSTYAEKALLSLPSSLQELLADADDAYYAAEYDRATELYRQALRLDSENTRAKDQLAKAEIARMTEGADNKLPRVAVQYYRRARSYIAARDVLTAINLLDAAIEAAQGKDMEYPEAEEALNNMQNLLTADEFRQKAKSALENQQWEHAKDFFNKALRLDSTNDILRKELTSLEDLLLAKEELGKSRISKYVSTPARWKRAVNTGKLVMNHQNRLLLDVDTQLNQLRWIRRGLLMFLIASMAIPFFGMGIVANYLPFLTKRVTPTATVTLTTTSVIPLTTTVLTINSPATLATETLRPNPTSTMTFTTTTLPVASTSTETILGVGYINRATVSTWQQPNSGLIEKLTLNYPVTILESILVSNSKWLKCRWERNEITREGWILADYITFGPAPTPRN